MTNDASHWLYNGSQSLHRPSDLGYFMGYRIAQSYYEKAQDKAQAIKDIIQMPDSKMFLERSGYAERFRVKHP